MKKLLYILLLLLSLDSFSQACLGVQNSSVIPGNSIGLPLGQYVPGEVITVTYTLQSFTGININWIHAFQIILGPGFINLTPITAPGNPPPGSIGNWQWDLNHIFTGGYNFGPGWRFVNTSNPDWGTSSTGPFTMSFQVTVGPTCTPDQLTISMEVLDDCSTGGWSNGNCCTDPPIQILSGSVSVPGVFTTPIIHY